jgi:hypothetical protein
MLHQFGTEYSPFGLWADQKGKDNAHGTDQCGNQHRRRKAHMSLDREVRRNRRYETADDRTEVITETTRRAAYLGREALGQVARRQGRERPAEEGALDDPARGGAAPRSAWLLACGNWTEVF